MTTNWKRTETANGAGAYALHATACARFVPERRIVRALRWKQDAVCRDASADAEPDTLSVIPADSASSSLTRTFFLNPLSNSTDNPKGNPNTNQKKKGKQTKQVPISQENP
jgi:hypothetical protein